MVDIPEFEREDRLAFILIAVFGVVQLAVIAEAWNKPLFWDSSVYTAMGKWIFSLGKYGFWENFRPPVLPFILGGMWKTGIPMVGFPRLLSAGISTAGLGVIYYGARDLFGQKEALFTVAILAASHSYVFFSLQPLTGIAASVLVFAGLYLVEKNRYMLAGVLLSLAFLTRFPAALGGPAAVFYILARGYLEDELFEAGRRSVLLTASFFAVAGVYLAFQQWFFGSILAPLHAGIKIGTGSPGDYLFGISYLLRAFSSNPLFLLALPGAYLAFREREWSYGGFALSGIFFYCFFTLLPLKIERYMLLFLPFMAVLAAPAVSRVGENLPDRGWFTAGFAAVLLLLLFFQGSQAYSSYTWESQEQQEFFSHVSELEGVVASNDPRVNLYGDFRYHPVPPGLIPSVIEEHGDEIDHWVINGRYWDCRGYSRCEQKISQLNSYLDGNYVVSSKVLAGSYNYTIYSRP